MSVTSLRGSTVPAGAYTPRGAMHCYVSIMNPDAVDSEGIPTLGTLFGYSWAKIQAMVGRVGDEFKQQQIVQYVTHLVTIPYYSGVTENMKILFEGRTFVIEDLFDPDERHVEMRMLTRELNQNPS